MEINADNIKVDLRTGEVKLPIDVQRIIEAGRACFQVLGSIEFEGWIVKDTSEVRQAMAAWLEVDRDAQPIVFNYEMP